MRREDRMMQVKGESPVAGDGAGVAAGDGACPPEQVGAGDGAQGAPPFVPGGLYEAPMAFLACLNIAVRKALGPGRVADYRTAQVEPERRNALIVESLRAAMAGDGLVDFCPLAPWLEEVLAGPGQAYHRTLDW